MNDLFITVLVGVLVPAYVYGCFNMASRGWHDGRYKAMQTFLLKGEKENGKKV